MIEGIIPNPQSSQQIPFRFECRIDTGFDGGIFVQEADAIDLRMIGIEPTVTNIKLADGRRIPARICAAYLQRIEDCSFPPPGKPVKYVFCGGTRNKLLGMDALRYCIAYLDGPKQSLELSFRS